MPTAIVYGPPACGKTRHAKQIADYLGIDPANIIDGWPPTQGRYPHLKAGYLYLCHEVPEMVRRHHAGIAMPIPQNVIVRPFSSFKFASQEGPSSVISVPPLPHDLAARIDKAINSARLGNFKNLFQSMPIAIHEPGNWHPYIGQPVRATEALLARYPEYRGEIYFVAEIRLNRLDGFVSAGINIALTEEWPVTRQTLFFTDGFYINRPTEPDDIEPVYRQMVTMEAQPNG